MNALSPRVPGCTPVSLLLLLLHALIASAQPEHGTREAGVEFLPGGTAFPPLMASYHEPRTGVRKEIGSSRLKLDIGTMIDFLEWRLSDTGKSRIRLGADFFTYALTTSSEGLRLQVDAVDGFFGGHIVFRNDLQSLSVRLRILHLSAHFVDGHYDNATGMWMDGRLPLPFTRDYGELVGGYELTSGKFTGMIYLGVEYATLVRPTEINRWGGLAGLQVHSDRITGDVLGKPFNLYAAYNFGLAGIPAWAGTNNIEFGAKFGRWDGTGLRIYASYYAGLIVFSQYYNERTSHWGIGFAFDVW